MAKIAAPAHQRALAPDFDAPSPERYVVLIGGANIDIKARISGPAAHGTSNIGKTTWAAGGVARNIAENLARLDIQAHLIAVVGKDSPGDQLLEQTQAAGVDVQHVLRLDTTGTYTAVLDHEGELLIAVAAMNATDLLTPDVLKELSSVIQNAAWVVADGNLSVETLMQLFALCSQENIPVVFEPVSVPKTKRLLPILSAGFAPHTITPNLAELAALVGHDVSHDPQHIDLAAHQLQDQGVHTVWVRRGQLGSLLYLPHSVSEHPALPATVRDVTGAGDAMLAAYLAALLGGAQPAVAAQHGHAAAALTVENTKTICPSLTSQAIQARLSATS